MLNSTVTELASNVKSTQTALAQSMNNGNTIAERVNATAGTLEEARTNLL